LKARFSARNGPVLAACSRVFDEPQNFNDATVVDKHGPKNQPRAANGQNDWSDRSITSVVQDDAKGSEDRKKR
jgi:hypothetical protein